MNDIDKKKIPELDFDRHMSSMTDVIESFINRFIFFIFPTVIFIFSIIRYFFVGSDKMGIIIIPFLFLIPAFISGFNNMIAFQFTSFIMRRKIPKKLRYKQYEIILRSLTGILGSFTYLYLFTDGMIDKIVIYITDVILLNSNVLFIIINIVIAIITGLCSNLIYDKMKNKFFS